MRKLLAPGGRDLLRRRAHQAADQLDIGDQLAQLRLHVNRLGSPDRLGEMAGEARQQLQLDHPADTSLELRVTGRRTRILLKIAMSR